MENQIPESRFAAWWNVIAADIACFSAASGKFAHAWSRRVAAWFRFVHRRRVDDRFAVFPGALRMAEIVLAVASIVVVLVLAWQLPVVGGLLGTLLMLAGFGALTALATGRAPSVT